MSIFIVLATTATFVFLPFFANPSLLLNRNNDLTEFFWPIFYYLKQNILIQHQIPTTNEVFFAGAPLLPDPQNPIWYLPNAIFLLTDIDSAILISLFVHTLFGAVGMYLAAKSVFNFRKSTSLLCACLFTLSPIFFSYLEAGHWGLAIAWSWLPYLLISSYNLASRPSPKSILLFAASASSIYFNHILTASIVAVPITIYWLKRKTFLYPFLASLLTLIAVSPALSRQISWLPDTTRGLLLANPETFPIWRGKREFIRTLFFFNPETEKAITIGVLPSFLALIGFLKLKNRQKLIVLLIFLILVILVLNNVSPFYSQLTKFTPFILMRVTIRLWPLVFLITLFLIGKALETLNKNFVMVLGVAAIIESTLIGYSFVKKPIQPRENIPEAVYKILESDKNDFRVLCLTRCIPQKEAAIRNLKLVEGYGTLQEKNYYYGIQKALNVSWNKYTLSIPPFDIYLYQEIQPTANGLRDFNVKYVISIYMLTDPKFSFLGRFEKYYLYYIR